MKYKRYKKGNYRMFLAGGTDDVKTNAMNMYNSGVIGSGNSPIGSTSTIVEEESDPNLQDERVNNFTEQQQLLIQQQQQVANETAQQEAENEIINEQKTEQANAEVQNSFAKGEQIASSGIKTGAELLAPTTFAANKLKNANAYSQLGSTVTQGIKNLKPIADVAGTGIKAGLGQIGAGLGKFAQTGAGIGTIGALAGAGVSRVSDDNDATTLNFGEGAGGVLSAAGTGASLGSLLGPGGTFIGGALGGLYGLGKGLYTRNKARKNESEFEDESNANISKSNTRFNDDLMSNYGSALSTINQGKLDQKSISGQDLGYNLTARNGGMRYGHGGFPAGFQMPMGQQGMEQPQGMMPTQIIPQPQQPMYKRGGMRMGMPRYGY